MDVTINKEGLKITNIQNKINDIVNSFNPDLIQCERCKRWKQYVYISDGICGVCLHDLYLKRKCIVCKKHRKNIDGEGYCTTCRKK